MPNSPIPKNSWSAKFRVGVVVRIIAIGLVATPITTFAAGEGTSLSSFTDAASDYVADATPYEFAPNLLRGRRPTSEMELRQWISSHHITAILSLDNYQDDESLASREAVWTESVSVRWIHYPMHHLLPPTADQLTEALSLLTSEPNGRVYVHCQYGKDRTGLVVAAYRLAKEHVRYSDVIDELYAFGHSWLLSYWDSVLEKFAE